MSTIDCKFCQQPFTPTRHWQKFCKTPCKRAHESAQMQAITGSIKALDGKNPAAVALGKLRMAKMTPEQRRELAMQGVMARLKNKQRMR